jgi:hypothetical protein
MLLGFSLQLTTKADGGRWSIQIQTLTKIEQNDAPIIVFYRVMDRKRRNSGKAKSVNVSAWNAIAD